jgi:hypothetical protein
MVAGPVRPTAREMAEAVIARNNEAVNRHNVLQVAHAFAPAYFLSSEKGERP